VSSKQLTVLTNRRQFLQVSGAGIAMTILGVNLARAASDETPVEIVQKIIVGKKVGKDDWPQYVPASFTLPAKRLIQVTVRCYDDGPADIPGGYNIVRGTVDGTMRVIKGTPDSISPQDGTVVKQIGAKETVFQWTMDAAPGLRTRPISALETISLPIGQSARPASLMCAHANGSPTMVIPRQTAVTRWARASHQPANTSQTRLPTTPRGPVPIEDRP
jgi:hypothetical protein